VSMPGYVTKALSTFQHSHPSKPQDAPHTWTAPVYSKQQQLVPTDITPLLHKQGIYHVQQICRQFLYCFRACNPTIIVALNEISSQQAIPTEKSRFACNILLDYLASHLQATIRYHASEMVPAVCSNAAYLVLPNACSRAAGHFFLTTLSSATSSSPAPKANGAIQVLCKILRTVSDSSTKAGFGALFLNAQEAVPICTAFQEMGHPQPASGTPLKTDNSTANSILKTEVRMRRSKAFDMLYHWLQDRIRQHQSNLFW
jgi:hypothetical protein